MNNKLVRGLLLAGVAVRAADRMTAPQLVELARHAPDSPALRSALVASMPEVDLKSGKAVLAQGPEFVFAFQSAKKPTLVIDDEPLPVLSQAGDVYYHLARLPVGRTHSFHYLVDGVPTGGRTDMAAWLPEAYPQQGVMPGKLTEKRVHTSNRIYPGMRSDYWVYTPAGYDPNTPAALMVWQDGEVNIDRQGQSHTLNVIDNLTAQKKIPVIVHVFVSPGLIGERRMRSVEYDTVDDTYARFLRDELLPEVARDFNFRKDAYSRGIIGESSGAICAFNVAWFQPELFSRVVSRIGSFTSIQWKPNQLDGGNTYPNKIRKEAKRNIRVWLQDGAEDLENEHGSWPLQNVQMANSLKRQGYDFHFSWGNGTHTRLGGQVEAAAELTWLWREYDPAKTEQTYETEAAEKSRPLWRIRSFNR